MPAEHRGRRKKNSGNRTISWKLLSYDKTKRRIRKRILIGASGRDRACLFGGGTNAYSSQGNLNYSQERKITN